MTRTAFHRMATAVALAVSALVASPAQAYGNLFVFGDSYSDTGNLGLALGVPGGVPQVIDNAYIPSAPYPTDGTYFPATISNGPAWPTTFAAKLGLTAAPSLAGGTDFAFAGARVGTSVGVPSLKSQVGMFFGSALATPAAISDAMFVVAGIGNDARDALTAIAGGAPLDVTVAAAAEAYAKDMGDIVDQLQAAGAQKILVVDVGNIGLAPAVLAQGPVASAIGAGVSLAMDTALTARLLGEVGVTLFDSFSFISGLAANPAAYGLDNASDACGGVAGADCSRYFFWDGIHPTAMGHEVLSNALYAAAVPEPETYALFALGLVGIGLARRRAKVAKG